MTAHFGSQQAPFRWRLQPLESLRQRGERRGRAARTFRTGLALISIFTTVVFVWLAYRWIVKPPWLGNAPRLVLEMVALVETAAAVTLASLWAFFGWRYWRRTRGGGLFPTAPVMSRSKLQELSPKAFERYVAGLFRQKGYTVVVRGRGGDLGVDLELTGPEGRRAIVQCKRYQNTVGAEVVRELYGTLLHERVARAFLVTTADISDSAREWARGKPLTLIDGAMLVQIAADLQQRLRDRELG